jgi:hypothetical protein
MQPQLPYIFVLDWDGTIVGKVDFQSHSFNVRNVLKKHGFKAKAPAEKIPKAFHGSSKLIRPSFATFVKTMQRFFPEVYFFIYTASERQWALQEIHWVEQSLDIQFQRPIFTRDDCVMDGSGNYRKSLMRIYPRICRAITKQRPLTQTEKEYILNHQLIVVDNNAVYTDKTDRLLLCPHYNYAVFEHLLELIPHEARDHPDIQQLIYSLVNQGAMCPVAKHDDDMHALSSTYLWLAARCKAVVDVNKAYLNDDFWKHLRKLIIQNELKRFTSSVIKQLQEAIWKKVKQRKKE